MTDAKYLLIDNTKPMFPKVLCIVTGFENAKIKREEIRISKSMKISIYRVNI